MDKIIRQWYQLGQVMVLIDYEFRMPIAYVDSRIKETGYTQWTPNQDAAMYEFVGHAGGDTHGFVFNPHNRDEAETAMQDAMDWCEDTVGQPYKRLTKIQFWIRLLMFWKYEPIRRNGQIVAVRPRGSNLDLDGRRK